MVIPLLITRTSIDVLVGEEPALSVDAAAGPAQVLPVMYHIGPLVPSAMAHSNSRGASDSVDRSARESSSVSALHAIYTRTADRRATPFDLNEGLFDRAFHENLARYNYSMQRVTLISDDSP